MLIELLYIKKKDFTALFHKKDKQKNEYKIDYLLDEQDRLTNDELQQLQQAFDSNIRMLNE
ncbi:MAG: hypothetical protein IPI23_19320 [Bacteroidetes bacterium]|nr:hypothetical protein [Bacteroidota bacterium]